MSNGQTTPLYRCPRCTGFRCKVVDSRWQQGTWRPPRDRNMPGWRRRRRQCLDCSFRFTTYEKLAQPFVFVLDWSI